MHPGPRPGHARHRVGQGGELDPDPRRSAIGAARVGDRAGAELLRAHEVVLRAPEGARAVLAVPQVVDPVGLLHLHRRAPRVRLDAPAGRERFLQGLLVHMQDEQPVPSRYCRVLPRRVELEEVGHEEVPLGARVGVDEVSRGEHAVAVLVGEVEATVAVLVVEVEEAARAGRPAGAALDDGPVGVLVDVGDEEVLARRDPDARHDRIRRTALVVAQGDRRVARHFDRVGPPHEDAAEGARQRRDEAARDPEPIAHDVEVADPLRVGDRRRVG